MTDWPEGELRVVTVDSIGERYRRYRLPDAAAEAAMAGSMARYGQISPLAVCLREDRPELLDGFKRVASAKVLPAVTSLEARLLEVDEPTAKAIILGLNGIAGRMKELEEAWIVQALVRAARFGAFSLRSVERILAAQAQPKTPLESLGDQQQQHLREIIEDRPVPPRPTGDYEQLYLDPQEPEDDQPPDSPEQPQR